MKWLDRTLMQLPCFLTLCTTPKQYKKVMKHLNIKDAPPFVNPGADATTHWFECGNKHTAVVCIRVPKGQVLSAVYALLVHEAVHVWQFSRGVLGEKEPSAEFEAYAIQNIAQNLFEAYK